MNARHALAKDAPKNRGGWPTGKEDQAIAFQKEVFERSKRLPTLKEVAEHVRVTVTTVSWGWARFMNARRKIVEDAGLATKTTAWGKPRDFREAEAVFQLEATFNATGRVPPVDDFATSLGVGRQIFNVWPVFRAAYRSLYQEHRQPAKKKRRPGGGRTPRNQSRDKSIIKQAKAMESNGQIDFNTLGNQWPQVTAGAMRQIIYRARKQGKLSRNVTK